MKMRVFRVLIIITSMCGMSAKHVSITTQKSWKNAQSHCKLFHTDLSPLTNEVEEKVFKRSKGKTSSGWIGLYMDTSSPSGWRWSGGTDAVYLNWHTTPSYSPSRTYNGYWSTIDRKWQIRYSSSRAYFFCLNLIVVEVKKSWEEALDHCREKRTTLTSLLSDTELLLAQREIQDGQITEPVWVGLRYLEGVWLWVNGDPLVYEAWPPGGDQDHQCPLRKRCGALNQEGLWENLDCQNKLHFICA